MTESPLTDTDLAELEAAAKAATPGPWSMHRSRERGTYNHKLKTGHMAGLVEGPRYVPAYEDTILARHDARFIALANPATVLRLLAELAAVKRERRKAWRDGFEAGLHVLTNEPDPPNPYPQIDEIDDG